LGKLSPVNFYDTLQTLCRARGLSLKKYSSLESYLQYVRLTDAIDVSALTIELRQLENTLYASRIQTSTEHELLTQSQRLSLMGKLVSFCLTPEEWSEYKQGRSSHGAPLVSVNLKPFEKFYEEADARDEAMAQRLLKQLPISGEPGHSACDRWVSCTGHESSFGGSGVATIDYVPLITKVDNGTNASYLNVFTQRKTPLDELFSGRTLFLAQSPSVPGEQMGAAMAMAEGLQYPGTLPSVWHRLIPNLTDFSVVQKSWNLLVVKNPSGCYG